MSVLLDPTQLGALKLKNRIVMAPLTRCRADYQRVPNDLMREHYEMRASMGLIISEATAVDPMGVGYPRTPGIWNEAQVKGWRKITDAVHAKGGLMILQLWHVGRVSHPFYLNDALPVAPSAIAAKGRVSLMRPEQAYVVPRALETHELADVVNSFRLGAQNAKAAGFDGVLIHGANGYLLDQFLCSGTNLRTDQYGGSLINRARLPLEVADVVIDVWGADRVGYHISPRGQSHDMVDANPIETFGFLTQELFKRGLGFLSIRESLGEGRIGDQLKKIFKGAVIANEKLTRDSAIDLINKQEADAVAFGVMSISNPDLVHKLANSLPLTPPNPSTFYNQTSYLFDQAEPMPAQGFYETDRRGYTDLT